MPEVDGLKTGYYRETGFNIVATAARKDLRLIAIVLGSPQARTRDNIVLEKIKTSFARYKSCWNWLKKGKRLIRRFF